MTEKQEMRNEKREMSLIVYLLLKERFVLIYITQYAEAGCYYKKNMADFTLQIQKIEHKTSNF
jgi:hypothetical protein